MRLHCDYETRSAIDLVQAGIYAYAEHHSTQAILLAWAIDDEPFQCWYIIRGEPIPERLAQALRDPDCRIVAHNSNFERVISIIVGKRQGFLPDDAWEAIRAPERWSCTAARAAAMGLPRALEKVAQALYLDQRKDMDGHHLMLEMCKPYFVYADGSYGWVEDAARIERLGQYAIQDGYTERAVDKELPELSPFEQEVWCTTERMNDRGVLVDDKLLQRLMFMTRDATNYLNGKLHALSQLENSGTWCGIGSDNRECYQRDGDSALNGNGLCAHCGGRPKATHATNLIPKVTNPQSIVKWLADYGIDTEDNKIGKWIIAGLLEDTDLPPIVREVLVTRRDGGKSSTAKFNTLMKRLNYDYRIRGSLLYAGAAATSRWSSRGAQLQNLPRGGKVKGIDGAIAAVMDSMSLPDIEKNFGPPMVVASELVRPMFIAPEGYWLARGDYSQIEDRMNAWLSGQWDTLEAFRKFDTVIGYDEKGKPITLGPDLYIVAAAQIYGVDPATIDKDDIRRQVGKVVRLACGYQGGLNAFKSMARIYNVKLPDEQAEDAKNKYRLANPHIVSFWADLNNAAIRCMQGQPGETHQVRNGIWFQRNNTVLTMRLPSGRRLVYWYPRLEMKPMPWDEEDLRPAVTYYAEDSQKKIWRRFVAYGGLFCENAVQAVSRDIMAYALVQLEKLGAKPVLTVHDEAVCQVSKTKYPNPKDAANAVKQVMLIHPEWLPDFFPLQADASAADRYVKA